MRRVDVLILGGGVIGLSCAWHLARRRAGLAITVVDEPALGRTASLAAAGMLAPYSEFGAPSPLFDLCRASLAEYPPFLGELRAASGVAIDHRAFGTILPELDDDDARHIGGRASFLAAQGIAHTRLTAGEVRARIPGIAPGVRGGLFLPDEAIVNPRDLHAALTRTCRAAGIDIVAARATALVAEAGAPGRFSVAQLAGADVTPHEIAFDRLLIATGAWTARVAALCGLEIPVRPVKGQIARLDAPPPPLGPVLHARDVYLAPRTDTGIVLGATMEERGFDTTVEAGTIGALVARAARYVPAIAERPVVESWAGLRPCPIDGNPILGRAFDRGNLWLATGHFRNGILLTPITGRLLADSLLADLDGAPDDSSNLPPSFRASRFGGRTKQSATDGE